MFDNDEDDDGCDGDDCVGGVVSSDCVRRYVQFTSEFSRVCDAVGKEK